jgi:hypothetical protein
LLWFPPKIKLERTFVLFTRKLDQHSLTADYMACRRIASAPFCPNGVLL